MMGQTRSLLVEREKGAPPLRPLTREQQTLLWQKWIVAKDYRARDRLIRVCLRHVLRIAARYRNYHVPISTLLCEGNRGVLCALRTYDSECGRRFVTYAAYWIRAQMLQCILDTRDPYRVDGASRSGNCRLRLKRERARMKALISAWNTADEH
ncbi:MAG: sigma factor [Polyangiaceae bacterium]